MNSHEPFLKAILADRHDDLPRLVYADWLEETGEPHNVARAHFIRTQITLETTDPKSQLFADMKALELRILDYYLEDWRFELPDFACYGSAIDHVIWRRGFPDDLGEMTVTHFVKHYSEMFHELPLTSLHLAHSRDRIEFERYSELTHLRRLQLGPIFTSITPEGNERSESTATFDSLMSAPVFTSLRELRVGGNRIDDKWLIRFVTRLPTASFAPTLEVLDLADSLLVTDAGANVLATSSTLDRLNTLRLGDTSITASGRRMLKKRFGSRLT